MQVTYSGEVANTAALTKQTAYTTTSTTPVLSGVGVVVTPLNGNTIYITGSAALSNTTATDGVEIDIYYAAGATTVPVGGTATVGYIAYGLTASITGSAIVPIDAVITGLIPNIDYVFTIGVTAITGGTASMTLNGLKIKDTI